MSNITWDDLESMEFGAEPRLTVKLRDGKTRDYADIDANVFAQFRRCLDVGESTGHFFLKHIQGLPFTEVHQ